MLQLEDIKYNLMNKDELFKALDRLTRVKPPCFKYRRVFYDIILTKVLEPKLNLQAIEELSSQEIASIIELIWNASVDAQLKEALKPRSGKHKMRAVVKSEEDELYIIDDETRVLCDANLNIDDLLNIPRPMKPPLNVERLYNINEQEKNVDTKKLREKEALKFPVEKIILCEGITEEILLPAFADILGFNFDKHGIHVISAGGKNQSVRWYLENKDLYKVPILMLLDADAEKIKRNIADMKKSKDRIYVIKNGEFEDIIHKRVLYNAINVICANVSSVEMSELTKRAPMVKLLTEIYRKHCLGDFKKADFAKRLRETLTQKSEMTQDIADIVMEIRKLKA